jgi:hypothetical protein
MLTAYRWLESWLQLSDQWIEMKKKRESGKQIFAQAGKVREKFTFLANGRKPMREECISITGSI